MTYTPVGDGICLGSDRRYYFIALAADGWVRHLPEGGCATMTEAVIAKMEEEK